MRMGSPNIVLLRQVALSFCNFKVVFNKEDLMNKIFIAVLFMLPVISKADPFSGMFLTLGGPGKTMSKEMPGDGKLGLFKKVDKSGKEFCRLRTRLVCDYGIGGVVPLKNVTVQWVYKESEQNVKTDVFGVLDIYKFECALLKNSSASIRQKEFSKMISLQSSVEEVTFPSQACEN